MMNKFLISVIFFVFINPLTMAQELNTESVNSSKLHYLRLVAQHMKIAAGFKYGIKLEKSQSGKINELAEASLDLEDKVLNDIFAEVFESKLTLEEVKEAYTFHSSETGIAIVEAQSKDPSNPRPKIYLTPTQRIVATVYMGSATGKKVGALLADRNIWDEFRKYVFAAVSK